MDFIPFTFVDFLDILLVASLMFGLYRMTRGNLHLCGMGGGACAQYGVAADHFGPGD